MTLAVTPRSAVTTPSRGRGAWTRSKLLLLPLLGWYFWTVTSWVDGSHHCNNLWSHRSQGRVSGILSYGDRELLTLTECRAWGLLAGLSSLDMRLQDLRGGWYGPCVVPGGFKWLMVYPHWQNLLSLSQCPWNDRLEWWFLFSRTRDQRMCSNRS